MKRHPEKSLFQRNLMTAGQTVGRRLLTYTRETSFTLYPPEKEIEALEFIQEQYKAMKKADRAEKQRLVRMHGFSLPELVDLMNRYAERVEQATAQNFTYEKRTDITQKRILAYEAIKGKTSEKKLKPVNRRRPADLRYE